MSENNEIKILSKILEINSNRGYDDEDDFSLKVARLYIENGDVIHFKNNIKKIKTNFFRKNKIKDKNEYIDNIYGEISKIKFSKISYYSKDKKTKQDNLVTIEKSLQEINKLLIQIKNNKLSIIGVILTIIFGLIGIYSLLS